MVLTAANVVFAVNGVVAKVILAFRGISSLRA
jgi:hypothetical protein